MQEVSGSVRARSERHGMALDYCTYGTAERQDKVALAMSVSTFANKSQRLNAVHLQSSVQLNWLRVALQAL